MRGAVVPRQLDVATATAIEMLEGRWTLRLLAVLVQGPARFSELDGAVAGMSRPMLSERLNRLAAAGLVRRTVAPGPPITSTYALTPQGDHLVPVLAALQRWAEERPAAAAR